MNIPICFNVIIPTRERADTLYHCLRTVVAQDYPFLNIIVSDNFSQDNTRQIVESFDDARIKYINTGRRLGMSQNWEFALRHISDGWITFLGDDDALMPGCLTKVAEVINSTGCDALVTKLAHYFWPGCNVSDNELRVPVTSGIEIRDSKKWLAKLMNGTAVYSELPMLYTGGFVKKSIIDSAKNIKGQFFLSMTPDVYSAIAISSVTDRYAILKEPVCLPGLSSHSNGASWSGISKNPDPAIKYLSEENIPFHAALGTGRVQSLSLLIYECYLQSMHLHHNFLNIDLLDQLKLAKKTSTKNQRSLVVEYCAEVAQLNGLVASAVSQWAPLPTLRIQARTLNRIKRYWQEITVDAVKFGVTDINEAAKLANAIYIFHKNFKYWRIANVMRSFNLLLSKLNKQSKR